MLKYLPVLFTFFIIDISYGQTQFVENKGQWDIKVKYRNDFSNGSFFLENQGFTVLLQDPKDLLAVSEKLHGDKPNTNNTIILHSHAYKVDFPGSAANVSIVPEKMMPEYNNYFMGTDRTKWAGDCKIYQAVTYQNVYPQIDVRYYSNSGNLKYDLIVHPGGDINAIAIVAGQVLQGSRIAAFGLVCDVCISQHRSLYRACALGNSDFACI